MTTDFEKRLATVGHTTLTPLVRRVLENDRAEVTGWRTQPLEGGFWGSHGVYRFQGEAQVAGETLNWSLILKATSPAVGSQEPAHWHYWQREVLVYQSDLLNNLPGGLAAPRCIAVVEYPGQESWLWLEDVVESEKVWQLERYGLAARHLGQFNGAYLVGEPIPNVPWLWTSRLRKRLAVAEPGMAALPQLNQLPVFTGLMPDDSLERSQKLWANRQRLLTHLDQLPQTLCHFDADRRNLIARQSQDGQSQTVAIDWAQLGVGVIGEELVALFAGSLKFVEFDISQIADLDAVIFAGYVDGLRDAGWQGDARLVRFGYATSAALGGVAERATKWPNIAKRVAALPPDAELPRLLSPGGPRQAVVKDLHLLSLGEEAYELLDSLES